MILKNFVRITQNYDNRQLIANDGTRATGSVTTSYLHLASSYGTYKDANTSNISMVVIGKGTTPVTFNDYVLADNTLMTGNDIVQVSSVEQLYNNDNKMLSITTSYQNVSSSPITVTEVGLDYKFARTATPSKNNALLTRTVLTTPVVIAPGEIYAFTVTITV